MVADAKPIKASRSLGVVASSVEGLKRMRGMLTQESLGEFHPPIGQTEAERKRTQSIVFFDQPLLCQVHFVSTCGVGIVTFSGGGNGRAVSRNAIARAVANKA